MRDEKKPARLLTIKEAGRRLGGKCSRTIKRISRRDPRFPRFIDIAGQHHVTEEGLDNYIAILVAAGLEGREP